MNSYTEEEELTTNVDFDLAEVEELSYWYLHDEISAGRHVGGARQVNSSSVGHDTWILSTYVIVPQGGRRNRR